ncbi:hypothetical protein B0H21DRAFT_729478 [Amylocystis lapponica]|nr:hypothetical protein B0H21DRAFT_729478 [Amylocystis lapponica]
MAIKLRMSISDILHRGVLYSLVGVSIWGIVMMGVVHRDTLRRGKGELYTLLGGMEKLSM